MIQYRQWHGALIRTYTQVQRKICTWGRGGGRGGERGRERKRGKERGRERGMEREREKERERERGERERDSYTKIYSTCVY